MIESQHRPTKLQSTDLMGSRNFDPDQLFRDWTVAWLKMRQYNVAPKTYANESSHAKKYFEPLGHIPLSRLTPGIIDDFLVLVAHQGRVNKPGIGQPHTVRICYSLLLAILKDAVRHEVLAKSPMAGTRRPGIPLAAPKFLSEVEAKVIMKAVAESGDARAMGIMLMLRLGLRRNEALGLIWDDIDLKKCSVQVRLQLGRVRTTEGPAYVRRELKTLASVRTLTLDGYLVERLRIHKLSADRAEPQDYVVTLGGGEPVEPDTVTKWIRTVGSHGLASTSLPIGCVTLQPH